MGDKVRPCNPPRARWETRAIVADADVLVDAHPPQIIRRQLPINYTPDKGAENAIGNTVTSTRRAVCVNLSNP